jgi:peptide deformylase
MATRPIITPVNPVLRQKARAVRDPLDPGVQQLIADMIETMRVAPGVGLAAPQVAASVRVITIEYAEPITGDTKLEDVPEPRLYVLINPAITRRSEEMVEGVEGCLSVPGYAGRVMRHESVQVKGINRQGKPVKVKASGWLARIFQHEIDHLDGTLFIDRAEETWPLRDGEEIEDV